MHWKSSLCSEQKQKQKKGNILVNKLLVRVKFGNSILIKCLLVIKCRGLNACLLDRLWEIGIFAWDNDIMFYVTLCRNAVCVKFTRWNLFDQIMFLVFFLLFAFFSLRNCFFHRFLSHRSPHILNDCANSISRSSFCWVSKQCEMHRNWMNK